MNPRWDSRSIVAVAAGAARRLEADVRAALPRSVGMLQTHFEVAASPPTLVGILLGPRSFPSLLVPFWIADLHEHEIDRGFFEDVCYSTLSGFLFIRLIDNVMDGDYPEVHRKLLPALGFFQSRFEMPYHRRFDSCHPFWENFYRSWDEHCDVTTADAFTGEIDLPTFRDLAARKFAATKVPVAATAMYCSRPELIQPWHQFVDNLGAFSQMSNDLFDWHHDDKFQIPTYLRSEWLRRRNFEESLTGWVLREGLDWGRSLLMEWSTELETRALELGSSSALQWLTGRVSVLLSDLHTLDAGLSPVKAVYNSWKKLEALKPTLQGEIRP